MDQLEDSQNVGAIFRSALAFNLDGIILTQDNSVNENSFLTKAASSAIDKVSFTKIKNISSCIKILKESGYWIYGLEMNAGKSLKEIEFPKKAVVILGSEHKGLRKITTSLCDDLIKIEIIIISFFLVKNQIYEVNHIIPINYEKNIFFTNNVIFVKWLRRVSCLTG